MAAPSPSDEGRQVRTALAAVALATAMASGVGASAHPMPSTTVLVSAIPGGFVVDVSIPLSELSAAMGAPIREGQADAVALRRYVLAHVTVVDVEGRALPARVARLEFDNVQRETLELSLNVQAPAATVGGGGARLRYDAVTHRIASHNVLVYFRGAAGMDPRPLGRLQAPATELPLAWP